VATDDQVQGVIAIEAVLRPEARRVVEALRRQGITQIMLVSGDTQGPTSALADALDLDESISNALPNEKGALVRRLQMEGHRVCFVGDGVNDALAMKHAKCAISLHGASAVATDSAGIILLDGDLRRMDTLVVAAHRQQSRLRTVLAYWGAYGIINAGLTPGLRMGVEHSSLFFGPAFAVGLLLAVPPRLDDDRGP
jgi:Cu2+-exporting ATPase